MRSAIRFALTGFALATLIGAAAVHAADTPNPAADAAAFFASTESSFCTGAVLLVDGGMKAGILRD